MKSVMKKLIRNEKGAALVVALVLLLVGGLISASLLGYMGTGILTGEVYESRTLELYASDAGVEDAIWKIQHGAAPVCAGSPGPWCYEIPDVNGRSVQVCIAYVDGTHKVTSTATTGTDGGVATLPSSTAVEAYLDVDYLDFSSLLDNAIVSNGTIEILGKTTVDGGIWLPYEDDFDPGPLAEYDPDKVKDSDDMIITWPTYEQLSAYYLDDLEDAPDPDLSVDVKYTKSIGPCDREGSLTVDNTGDPDMLVLEGTVYVRGNLKFQQSGSHNYTVKLNGQTIFAEGNIDFASNVVSISGPGCIIAAGYVNFQPSIAADDFVLVMSITDDVFFHPSGDFTGCIAGNLEVQLQPGCTIDWVSPEGKGLDFPMGVGDDPNELPPVTGLNIESWEIKQQ